MFLKESFLVLNTFIDREKYFSNNYRENYF